MNSKQGQDKEINLGLNLMKRVFRPLRKNLEEAEKNALKAELFDNYEDYLACIALNDKVTEADVDDLDELRGLEYNYFFSLQDNSTFKPSWVS